MAFNNYFPTGYQPYQPNMFQGGASSQQTGSALIWVQGINAAKSYPVAPNTSVPLFDSEANVVYIKSADASGMPSIKILDYIVRDNAPKQAETQPQGDYVTHDELADIQRELNALKSKFERGSEKRGKSDGK